MSINDGTNMLLQSSSVARCVISAIRNRNAKTTLRALSADSNQPIILWFSI